MESQYVPVQHSERRIMSVSDKVDLILEWSRKHSKAVGRCLIIFFYYVIGIEYYHKVEGWDRTECIYFITVSVTTVGYGQLVPSTDPARIFTVFYVLFGIGFVLTAALDFSKYAIVSFQDRLLTKLHSSENIIFKEMNKVGLCVFFLGLAILMGTCFYAVNEDWTAAEAFYWTMMTMTTVGYGDLKIKYHSTRQFSIFFIIYCVLVFATVIQNMSGSYDRVTEHRGRMLTALISLQNKDKDLENLQVNEGTIDIDVEEDKKSAAPIDEAVIRRNLKKTFGTQDEQSLDDDNRLDVNEFVIEALLKCHVIDYEKNLEPILNHLRGLRIGDDGLVDREEISKFYNSQEQQPSDSPVGSRSYNPIYRINSRVMLTDKEEKERSI